MAPLLYLSNSILCVVCATYLVKNDPGTVIGMVIGYRTGYRRYLIKVGSVVGGKNRRFNKINTKHISHALFGQSSPGYT